MEVTARFAQKGREYKRNLLTLHLELQANSALPRTKDAYYALYPTKPRGFNQGVYEAIEQYQLLGESHFEVPAPGGTKRKVPETPASSRKKILDTSPVKSPVKDAAPVKSPNKDATPVPRIPPL
jgi:hypothetical protein